MFVLIVELQAAPARRAELESLLASLVRHARSETGILHYAVQRQQDDPSRYILIEYYRDKQAWEAHIADPVVAGRIAQFSALLTAAPKLSFCDQLYAL